MHTYTQIKLVATDIDGTLTNDQRELSAVTIHTLQTLLKRGMPVVLVTGLNPWTAGRYARQIGHGVRVISFNGVFLIEDGEICEGKFVPLDVAREATRGIAARGYVPLVYGEDGVERYVPAPAGMSALHKLRAERSYQPFVEVARVDDLFPAHPAVVSVCDTDARARPLYEWLISAVGARAYVVYQPLPTRTWVEVNHPEARKDVALLALAQRLGITAEEILYFGDSLNDLPVFRAVPHCVAVDNAREEVKSLAWRIAPPNTADGVAQCLQAFI